MAEQSEGNEQQKRKAAREAKAEGKKPSAVGATRGASKQRKHLEAKRSHKERFETRQEGKVGQAGEGAPNPQPHNEF